MIRAVLFDWGETLVDTSWNADVALEANRVALRALARDVEPEAVSRWFSENEAVFALESTDEVDVLAIYRSCFSALGWEASDDELDRYLHAWHGSWEGSYAMHPEIPDVLAALRRRGLRLGVVSNVISPGRYLAGAFARHGLDEAVDVLVFSSDHGKRKPDAAIFRAALEALDVAPEEALFVGDRLAKDVAGAGAVGMATVQAVWFREEDGEPRPDFVARSPREVLDIVDRCVEPSRS